MQEYGSWMLMKSWCLYPGSLKYPEFGGKGVKMCERWLEFDNFVKDMGKRPSADFVLERIDASGDFEKNNCKWVKKKNRNIKTEQDD